MLTTLSATLYPPDNCLSSYKLVHLLVTRITARAAQREASKAKESGQGAGNQLELGAPRSGPYFDKVASKNVTALLGKTAYLNCRVKNLGNKTMVFQVSWVRHRDIHLLTVGRYTYTSDQRFRAIHHPHSEDWTLQIKYPQHRDTGMYECQISTNPHMSHMIHLEVVVGPNSG
ncbi:SFRICE_033561 [Gryllus bimaculatus]|nr:SFRICE_033561 [Gryllus bimaculatus]